MLLNLSHIYKDYQQEKLVVPVLKDVSLSVEEGEYVAIMGPSGSGKTTLMNIIGCLDLPTSGSYELSGQDVLACKDRELADCKTEQHWICISEFSSAAAGECTGKCGTSANLCRCEKSRPGKTCSSGTGARGTGRSCGF